MKSAICALPFVEGSDPSRTAGIVLRILSDTDISPVFAALRLCHTHRNPLTLTSLYAEMFIRDVQFSQGPG